MNQKNNKNVESMKTTDMDTPAPEMNEESSAPAEETPATTIAELTNEEPVSMSTEVSEDSPRNYVADLVNKSRDTAVKVADNLKQRIPTSVNDRIAEVNERVHEVNERVANKVSNVFAKIHSSSAPESLKDFQSTLMGLYNTVMLSDNMTEIRATLFDSSEQPIPVTVRRVYGVAVVVSIRGLTAFVDFAEQKIKILFPAVKEENPCTASKLETIVQSKINILPVNGLAKRLVVLPIDISFRFAKSVNMRSDDLIHLLQASAATHLEMLATRMPAVNRFPTIVANLKEHAEEHIQFNILKENAHFYAKRLVQLRRDIFEAVAHKLPAEQLEKLQSELKSFIEHPAETVRTLQASLMTQIAALRNYPERLIALLQSLRLKMFEHELIFKVLAKKDVVMEIACQKKNDLNTKYDSAKNNIVNTVNTKKEELLSKKQQLLNVVDDKKSQLMTKKDEIISSVNEKKVNFINEIFSRKDAAFASVVDKKAVLTAAANEKLMELSKSHPVVANFVSRVGALHIFQ